MQAGDAPKGFMTGMTQRLGHIIRRDNASLLAGALVATLALAIAGSAQHLGFVQELAMLHGGSSPGGHASQGYLGVNLRDIPDEQVPLLKLSLNGSLPRGAEIMSVDHDGPAGKAGLREHDVVLQMNGQAVEGGEPLRRMLRDTPPGRTVTLLISRAGQQQTISAQMANREDVERQAWEQHWTVPDPQPSDPVPPPERRGSGFFSSPGRASRSFLGAMVLSPGYTGAMLETMAPQLAEFFGAQGKTGLLVRSVDSNSPAALAGMRAGDVVVRVNTTDIATSSDWLRTVRENKGKTINVVVLRDRREQTLSMIPNAKHHSSLLPERWRHLGWNSAGSRPVPVLETVRTGLPPGTFTMI